MNKVYVQPSDRDRERAEEVLEELTFMRLGEMGTIISEGFARYRAELEHSYATAARCMVQELCKERPMAVIKKLTQQELAQRIVEDTRLCDKLARAVADELSKRHPMPDPYTEVRERLVVELDLIARETT